MSKEYRLTTKDNPYNPFTQFVDWWLYDVGKGYNSSAYLDRIAHTSSSFTDDENNEEIERAINEIIAIDPFDLYEKVERPVNLKYSA